MPRDYADMSKLISQNLQDTGVTEFVVAGVNYQIEEGLKAISTKIPHIIDVIFDIESRSGQDTAGTTDSLTDTTKSQFLAGDATGEKVVHNTTKHTRAVVETFTSTSVLVLSADIMSSSDSYRIYNKRCWNQRQIYIGDVPEYLGIDSVEYPIGMKRNWTVYNDVLEIDVHNVADSDSTLANLGNVDVLVRFKMPHVLSQLTDLVGACTAVEPVDETTLAVKEFGTTEIFEAGDELQIENKRFIYLVTADVTMSTGAGNLVIFPPLEAATAIDDVITAVKSTLTPALEEILAELVTGRLLITQAPKYLLLPTAGGVSVWRNLHDTGAERRNKALADLKALAPRVTKIGYSAD